jgi:hypothetical protein
MKTITLLILIGCLLAVLFGCARLNYVTPDGTQVTYTRFMTTSDSIQGNVGDAKIAVTKQAIDTTLAEALLKLLTTAK